MPAGSGVHAQWLTECGWMVLHCVWQGALLGLVYAVLRRQAAGFEARQQYRLGIAVLAMMLACPMITLAGMELCSHGARVAGAGGMHAAGHMLPGRPEPDGFAWASRVVGGLDAAAGSVGLAWMAAAGAGLCWIGAGLLAVRRLRREAKAPVPAALMELAAVLAQRMGMSMRVRFAGSDAVRTPLVTGWRQPVIVVPVGFAQELTAAQAQAVLAHELAHVRGRDYAVNLTAAVVLALFWFHPAAWWVCRGVRRDREYCCDDAAVAMTGSVSVYAKALVALAGCRAPGLFSVSPGISGGVLTMRVQRLLERRPCVAWTWRKRAAAGLVGVAAAAGVVGLSVAATGMVYAQTQGTQAAGARTAFTASWAKRRGLSCTFYENGLGSAGICGVSHGVYTCTRIGDRTKVQEQIGCKDKVQRVQAR